MHTAVEWKKIIKQDKTKVSDVHFFFLYTITDTPDNFLHLRV